MSANLARVVAQNVLAMVKEPISGSEMVSQAVMGAPVRVLDTRDGYSLIEGEDRYQGWVLSRWLAEPLDTSDNLCTTVATLFCEVHAGPTSLSPIRTKLTAGARVVVARKAAPGEYVPLILPTQETAYTHRVHLSSTYSDEEGDQAWDGRLVGKASAKKETLSSLCRQIAQAARRFVGTPYLWGGTTPFGLDCSGFTQLVYRLNGVLLLRDAYLQYGDRRFIAVEEGCALPEAPLLPADLVFFGGDGAQDGRRITHVGMALGDGTFIHSAGSGRGNVVSACSDPDFAGIYVGARRISPDADLAIDAA